MISGNDERGIFSRFGGFRDASTRRARRISGCAAKTFIYLRRMRVNHDVGGVRLLVVYEER